GLLLHNRLLWVGIALVLFALAYVLFRFEAKGKKARKRRKLKKADVAPPAVHVPVTPRHDRTTRWRQLGALTRFDMAYVFKSPAFLIHSAVSLARSRPTSSNTFRSRAR